MIKKNVLAIFFVVIFLCTISPVYAHVSVKPSQAGIGAFQVFSISVPNEKDNPTVALRLVIPKGLAHVSPNVKAGWNIDTKKSGEGEDANVTEINWTGGSIPQGQRDDFIFSAQVPSSETTINWKAYQTYANGDVVSWDQNPSSVNNLSSEAKEKLETEGKGPYSQTQIINDLKNDTPDQGDKETPSSTLATMTSLIAIILASLSLYFQFSKKK